MLGHSAKSSVVILSFTDWGIMLFCIALIPLTLQHLKKLQHVVGGGVASWVSDILSRNPLTKSISSSSTLISSRSIELLAAHHLICAHSTVERHGLQIQDFKSHIAEQALNLLPPSGNPYFCVMIARPAIHQTCAILVIWQPTVHVRIDMRHEILQMVAKVLQSSALDRTTKCDTF